MIKCLKGHWFLRSLFNVKKQKWLSESLSHWVTESVSDKVTYWAVRWQLKSDNKLFVLELSNWARKLVRWGVEQNGGGLFFAKCTQLTNLLSFASLFLQLSIQHDKSSYQEVVVSSEHLLEISQYGAGQYAISDNYFPYFSAVHAFSEVRVQ